MSAVVQPVYFVGLGASTPVGRDALSSAAAVRAGISGFAEHPYMIDSAGEPMRAAIAPWLDRPGLNLRQRLVLGADETVAAVDASRLGLTAERRHEHLQVIRFIEVIGIEHADDPAVRGPDSRIARCG